jgi:hypothetical protein
MTTPARDLRDHRSQTFAVQRDRTLKYFGTKSKLPHLPVAITVYIAAHSQCHCVRLAARNLLELEFIERTEFRSIVGRSLRLHQVAQSAIICQNQGTTVRAANSPHTKATEFLHWLAVAFNAGTTAIEVADAACWWRAAFFVSGSNGDIAVCMRRHLIEQTRALSRVATALLQTTACRHTQCGKRTSSIF